VVILGELKNVYLLPGREEELFKGGILTTWVSSSSSFLSYQRPWEEPRLVWIWIGRI